MTTGVSTAFTNNVTLTVDTWFNDVNKRTYGDFATVASHATAAPIWANGIHFIDYTGTAATTAFPNALQAGDSRTLICAAACTFTAGANMLIQGFASGEVFTAEAYDEVLVVAKTTTIFVLTIKQYSFALATAISPVANGAGLIGTSKKVARQDHVHPADVVPAGTIIDFGGSTAPAGYLACPLVVTNISRTTYATLFAAIGTLWGAGDGSTTFGMPYFPDNYPALNSAPANVGTSTIGAVISHSHTITPNDSVAGALTGSALGSSVAGAVSTGSTGGAANYAAGMRVLKCVKY